MLTFIDNEPVTFQGGTMKDEDFVKSDEYKEITQALQTLAKHCPSLIVSAYTAKDHSAFVYNHARGQDDGNHLYEVVKKQKGKKAADEALRGTDLATHITNLLVDAKKQHGVDADAVISTVQKGQIVMEALNKMNSGDKTELFDALKKSESPEEAIKLMKERIKELDEPQKRNGGGAIRKKYHDLEDMFVKTKEKEDIDVEQLTRTVKLATGAEAKAFKMSDPHCIPALSQSLSNNLKATTIVGYIKTEKNGDISATNVEIFFQNDINDLAEKNDLDATEMRIALAGSLGVSIFRTMKEKYGLPDGLFAGYLEKEKL